MKKAAIITNVITCERIPAGERIAHSARLFGHGFPFRLEPAVYSIARKLSDDYNGGSWMFNRLSNGGFYMIPESKTQYSVSCENGYEGSMSADALGITVCLYAYSHLSFGDDCFAEVCAEQYHALRDYMLEHPEAKAILQAID